MTFESGVADRVKVVKSYEALSQLTAEHIANLLKANPQGRFGLPTGSTPKRCYEILAEWSRNGQLSWSKAKCFALDDYIEVEERFSFQYYLESNLYRFTDLPQEARFNPRQVDNYDQLILDQGGLDFCLLGIGENGHIAFNEPPTPRESWTHCVWLSEETKRANRKSFEDDSTVPTRAITMGVSTLLSSGSVVLIASGKNKRKALHRALTEPPGKDLPASFLTTHANLHVIADFDW
jgi:glucosamine-6-phosphate deaminase